MKLKKLKLILVGILLCTATAFADVQINETNFPDESFRNWLLMQPYGNKGFITDAEIANITTMDIGRLLGLQAISDLTGIQFFTNLEILYCDYNVLTSLDVSGLTNLEYLHFSNNFLTSIDVSGLTNLQTLICRFNQLTSLDVSGLNNLKYLDCGYNQLTSLDVSDLTNLEYLYCINNFLTSLDLTELNNLNSDSFYGNSQTQTLTLTGANDNYNLNIDLNNPTNLASGLSYVNSILTSTSNTITSSSFRVETGKAGFTLSGTLNLNYTFGTSITEIKNENKQAIAFYSIIGAKLHTEPQSGIYIVLYDDGTSEKVVR